MEKEPLCPYAPASRTRDRAASAGVRRGGEEGCCLLATLSGCWEHRWQLSSQASYGQGDPVIRRPEEHQEHQEHCAVRVVSCVRHRSASALRRWLRRAGSALAPRWLRTGFALLTWDPEPETPLAFSRRRQTQ
ncbi:hypothetical protein NDU88_003471 [Pleurodeles waltl]|uniref:Uncharacterized protein n=1 Tax=Pleurodeles waltl TaxID=8319 RepID=A0AAV7WRH9_PLEWA|nr:hypothetical protein NDU88_003471 [Pleurodeles waltl]